AGLLASPALAQGDLPPSTATATPAPAAMVWYFDRALTDADLQGRSLRELSLLRNTIFARAGNPFRKDWLNAWFRAQPWYTPAKTWDPAKITPIDWENAKTIAAYESSLKRAELEARATAVKARLKAAPTPEDRIELRLLSVRLGKWQEEAQTPKADRSPLEDPSLLDTQLTNAQLANMSRRDLRLLRNMIYARHGYTFKSELLGDYFASFDWYTADPAYTTARLTRLDWRNIKVIKSLENELGGPMTDWEHMKEDGWFVAA
ncbi:MAG: YARHG domain-containing protein, partial [Myxococcales bacterium]|nr:YARHG domain-containing protein [Myxococcales bacterium]